MVPVEECEDLYKEIPFLVDDEECEDIPKLQCTEVRICFDNKQAPTVLPTKYAKSSERGRAEKAG